MKANKNTKKSWLVYLSMVDISTNFKDKISRGSGENRSGSRTASVAGTGGTLYRDSYAPLNLNTVSSHSLILSNLEVRWFTL